MANTGFYIILCIDIAIIIILGFIIIRSFKKNKEIFEKSLLIIFLSVALSILALYVFDTFNIPTILGINKNVDSQNWLMVLTTFASVIISELLAGLFLLFVTNMQIQENRRDILEKENEDRRISNMPLLIYDFSDEYNLTTKSIYKLATVEKGNDLHIVLSIKNIGMNAVRKCYIQIMGKSLAETSICELDNQSSLDKNEIKSVSFNLTLGFGKHEYILIAYYEDLLHNWYKQEINYEADIEKTDWGYYNVKKFKVGDEEKIENPYLKTNVERCE